MFAAELLMGGNPITGALGGLACCAMMGTAIYAMRKKIPHPSEFAIIGAFFSVAAYHKTTEIDVLQDAAACEEAVTNTKSLT